ncbi:MAG: Na+/H+ antiporter NhaA [Desulfobacterales bacterium]|uniref:Na+/H+ antiporter NhaA n=1 Tax=Candidatus Desulfatibia vada TaxID=2841696 RepID=A0A8J6P8N2_9BACT|nr:Na+/H+ antiporter NhaA [Candidatus Desulfatibia vada]MBL6971340.1 Na+/H+ antiporter NhaA [Desulfobacterales bacterium]
MYYWPNCQYTHKIPKICFESKHFSALIVAFAIADDLGAVVVIALFYTKSIVWSSLGVSVLFLLGLAIANRLWVRSTLVYAILGLGLWYTILGSGIHATVAGVIVAMFIPARGRYDTDTFLKNVSKNLHAFDCESDSCGYSILLNRTHLNKVKYLDNCAKSYVLTTQPGQAQRQRLSKFCILSSMIK